MMGDNRGESDDSRFWGPVPASGSSVAPSPPTGRPSASASSKPDVRAGRQAPLRRRRNGSSDDRALGCAGSPAPTRPAAAAWPARSSPRPCSSTSRRSASREVRALRALNDSKQHTAEAREALYPVVLRTASRSPSSRAARAASTPAACTGPTSPRCATSLLRSPVPAASASATASRSATSGHERQRDRRRRRDQRRDRRRLDRRQGHPRPLHAPRRRAPPRLGVRGPRRLLDARAPRGDPAPGVSPLHRMSFQSTAYQQLAL